MTMVTILISVLVGIPILFALASLAAVVPFFLLGCVGAVFMQFKPRDGAEPIKEEGPAYPSVFRYASRREEAWRKIWRAN